MRRSEMSLGYRKNPLVSIVVPAYNAEQHIDECLRSLANQTYSRIEVIVVDDGSKDRTTDCCLLWKSVTLVSLCFVKRIKAFRKQGIKVFKRHRENGCCLSMLMIN